MNETTTITKTESRYIVKIGTPALSTPTVDYIFYAKETALELYHEAKRANKNVTVIKETVSTETTTTTVI